MILAKPHKMYNSIQHYAWGERGSKAFIPNFIGIKGEDKPYAELWIGAHPKLSSKIKTLYASVLLSEAIDEEPDIILGPRITKKFKNKLPFLLKVLSAERALSIQTHPNKQEAIKLHKTDPEHYPDNNHKPEIAIALTSLLALVGFRELDEIEKNILKYSHLLEFIGENEFLQFRKNKNRGGLKNLFTAMMRKSLDKSRLKAAIESTLERIKREEQKSEDEEIFISLYEQYGVDIGLFVLFFLNVVNLNSGEAIFTPPGIPHAYLKGNIVECMANSDNVVRAGLTPKFKDIEKLTDILTYDFGKPKIYGEKVDNKKTEYEIDVEEFEIERYEFDNSYLYLKGVDSVEIILIIEGEANIGECKGKKGDAFLIPSVVKEYFIRSRGKFTFFRVKVPE